MPYLEQGVAERDWDYSKPYSDHRIRCAVDLYRPTAVRRVDRLVMQSAADSGRGRFNDFHDPALRLPGSRQVSGTITVSGALGDYGGNHGDLSPGSSGVPTDFYFGGNGTGVIISSRVVATATCPSMVGSHLYEGSH